MMVTCMLYLLILIGLSMGDLPPPEKSYKILMLLPVASKSHMNVVMPLAEALADRGHKVVILSSYNKTSENPNIEDISHGLPSFFTDDLNMFEVGATLQSMMGSVLEYEINITRELYKVPQVKELYERNREFDVIFKLHALNEMVSPFLHEMPFIVVVPFGIDSSISAIIGNPLHPAYVNNFVSRVGISTTFGRLMNLFLHTLPIWYWKEWVAGPVLQRELLNHFPDLPSIREIDRNMSLTLLNTHFSLDMVLPLLPSEIEVGGMHCGPGKPLPENLNSWIEGAGSSGVVYFSLGSITRGDTMPPKYRRMFLEAFGKLKQRVIWKYEGELENVPKNVMISKWLPQQDILAHPNVIVFISHGGGLSTQESSYHGVPMLILPLYGDQPKNAEHIAETERGLHLEWKDLSEILISDALHEILTNTKYKDSMEQVSKSYKDQLQSPKDRAVFWTEYVIRHKGAPQLRSPAAELSWLEFLLLDVLALLLLILVVIFGIVYIIIHKIVRFTVKGKERKKKRE